MTAHIPPDRHLPSQEAVDLVIALQRCLTNFHARKEEPAILDGEGNDQLPALARYLEARRVRAMLFGQNLFADPAWDILLALYQAELEGVALTLEQLSETLRLSLTQLEQCFWERHFCSMTCTHQRECYHYIFGVG